MGYIICVMCLGYDSDGYVWGRYRCVMCVLCLCVYVCVTHTLVDWPCRLVCGCGEKEWGG